MHCNRKRHANEMVEARKPIGSDSQRKQLTINHKPLTINLLKNKTTMIKYVKYQNKNEQSTAYNKWYGRAVIKETVGIETMAERIEQKLDVEGLIARAIENTELVKIRYQG